MQRPCPDGAVEAGLAVSPSGSEAPLTTHNTERARMDSPIGGLFTSERAVADVAAT